VADVLLVWLAMALAALGVVLAHSLARYAFARLARLPLERTRLRVPVRLAGSSRTGGRLAVLAASSAVAYLAVAGLAFAFGTFRGVPTGESVVTVRAVLDGFDAAGKLQPGDRIVAVDGEPLVPGRAPSLTERVVAKQGAPVTLMIRRAGASLDVTIQPKQAEADDPKQAEAGDPKQAEAGRIPAWVLGVRQRVEPEVAAGAAAAAAYALRFPVAEARSVIVDHLVPMFSTGNVDVEVGDQQRLLEEFVRADQPVGLVAWRRALLAATCTLLVLALLDLAGAASLIAMRARR
jgi:hypothetical protein